MEKCFACGKKLGKNPKAADTRDDQHVLVGSECYKKIIAGGEAGFLPKDCLRLWELKDESFRITGGGSNV